MPETLSRFGVPLKDNSRGIILQPKVKWKWRVILTNFGPIGVNTDITSQISTVGRPHVTQEPVTVHSYNSRAYYAGKHEWQTLEMKVRDDVTNSVATLVGAQQQKQINHFEQTTLMSGHMYKFDMMMEQMDGGNDVVLEQWQLEGCFLSDVNYDENDYSSNDPLMITMTVRFDNATQWVNDSPIVPPGMEQQFNDGTPLLT